MALRDTTGRHSTKRYFRSRLPLTNWRILVADASPGERERLMHMLQSDLQRTCTFVEASCAIEARALVEGTGESGADAFDCALIDFDLPGMQTAELIESISGDDGGPRCPVVVLSVAPTQQASTRMLRAGAQDFLGKSWTSAPVLLRTVENAIERWAMTRELSAHAESLRRAAALAAFRSALLEATRQPRDSQAVRLEATRVLGDYLETSRVLFGDVSRHGELALVPKHWQNRSDVAEPYPIDELGAHALRELKAGRPVAVASVAEDENLTDEDRARLARSQVGAMVIAPVLRGGSLVCALAVQQDVPRLWTQEEVFLTTETAESLWEAIERARAQERLRASEARYQLAMDAGRMGIWWWRPQTSEAAWDANCAQLLGLPPCDDITMNASDLFFAGVHPEDVARMHADVEQVMKNGGHYRHEFRYRRPADGRSIWMAGYAMAVPDAAGQQDHLIGITVDVTDQKRVAGKLQESERLHAQLIAQLPSFTAVLRGPEHVFEMANAAYYSLSGRGGEIIGQRLCEAFPEMQGQPFMALLDQVYASGESFSASNMSALVRRGGGLVEVALDFVYDPLRNGDGQVTGILVHGVERTEQVRAQRGLDRARKELQTITDNLPDMVMRVGQDTRHLFANAAVEKVTGVPREKLIGRTGLEAGLSPEMCAVWQAGLRRVFASGRSETLEYDFHAMGEQAADERRQFSTRLVPERSEAGEIDSVLCITQDVTERRQLLQNLIDQDRRKDEFIATLAHELRNPLAPLRTGLQVLELSGSPQMQARTLKTMKRQLAQMVRLIDDLLDLSRVSSGKIVLQRERVELRAVIEMALESARPVIDAAQHRLDVSLPDTPQWLDADPTRVAQIVLNLLTNAAKYTSPGGCIEVVASRQDGEAVIAVSDTGMGIPPDMLERVFDMFTQVNNALDRAQGGLGIGLALVRRLAQMHGGTITAESEGKQRGSRFTLRLPLAIESKTASPAPVTRSKAHEPAQAVAPRASRVLVVDDNIDGAETLALMLELSGYATRAVFSGQAALDEALRFEPDVVFLDIGLPGMNGYEVARRFRGDPALAGSILVALTGWGTEDDQRRSREAGFNRHLTKPVESETIEQVLLELLADKTPLTAAEAALGHAD